MSNANTLASLMIEGLKSVRVTFNSNGREYTYKTLMDFEVGDLAVVEVSNHFKVVEVVAVDLVPNLSVDSEIEYKWIVQKLDTTDYESCISSEKALSDNLRVLQQRSVVSKARELMAEMLSVDKQDIDEIL